MNRLSKVNLGKVENWSEAIMSGDHLVMISSALTDQLMNIKKEKTETGQEAAKCSIKTRAGFFQMTAYCRHPPSSSSACRTPVPGSAAQKLSAAAARETSSSRDIWEEDMKPEKLCIRRSY